MKKKRVLLIVTLIAGLYLYSETKEQDDSYFETKSYNEKIERYKKNSIYSLWRVEIFEENQIYDPKEKFSQKIILSTKTIDYGFLFQQDQAEENIFDYTSYFIKYHNKAVNSLIFGNYKLGFGQGIIFGDLFKNSKSTLSTKSPIVKKHYLKPYTSFYENWLLNGIAADISIANTTIVPYFSTCKLDANLSENEITSFYESGVHYDDSKKDKVKENIKGLYLKQKFILGSVGFNSAQFEFDKEFEDKKKSNKYNAYSLDWYLENGRNLIFGEYALVDGYKGEIYGFRYGQKKFNQLIIYRNYEDNLPTFRGNPISSSSNFDNERGFYYGINFFPIDNLDINYYVDIWKIPEVSYYEKLPLTAYEELLNIEYKIGKSSFIAKIKYREKEELIEDILGDAKKYQYKLDYIHNFNRVFQIKFRGEYDREIEENLQYGYLFYQRVKLKYDKFEIIAFINYYKTQVPIYMYENNVFGIVQISSFSGEDFYYFLLTKFKQLKPFILEFKYSDYVDKPQKNRIYCQLSMEIRF